MITLFEGVGKEFSDEVMKYLKLSLPPEHEKLVIQSLKTEKIKAGVVKYLQEYFKLPNGTVKDAGIETGACYNIKLDLSEVYEDQEFLENTRGFSAKDQKAGGGRVVYQRFSVMIITDPTNLELMKTYNQEKPFKVERNATIKMIISNLKLRTNFFLHPYPLECIRLVKKSSNTIMKNTDDPLSKYFADNEVDIEIKVELHNMIQLNISEKQQCFLNQDDKEMKTLDNIVQKFSGELKANLTDSLDMDRYLE